ncbi:ABC transporter permease [bacterium]|nr:ABC transporter permease [candidate division CSSED10-310 bacterium]
MNGIDLVKPGVIIGRWFRIRENVPRSRRVALGAVPILALGALWWVLTTGVAESRIISPVILPSPGEVIRSLPSLWFERALTRSIWYSFIRVIGGFVAAMVLAFPLGVAMGSFGKIKAMFNPVAVFGGYVPIPALVPLTLSLFGTGELQKIMFLGLAFFVYLLPLFVKAVDQVDEIYLKTAYTLGADKRQTVSRVLLPLAWSNIFQAMRIGFGIGWGYIILAEMVSAQKGLGSIIIVSQRRGPREHIYLVLLVIILIAFVTDKLWLLATRRLFPYERKEGK